MLIVRAPILIVGQGLAGTLLGWEFERAGIDFEIADAGHEMAASRIGAGIINPVTGRRIVKSWRVEEFLPFARNAYREMEARFGASFVTEMRVRRFFRDDRERRVFAKKMTRGELAPFVLHSDEQGFWIDSALRIDTGSLIASAQNRWAAEGRLRRGWVSLAEMPGHYDLVILCTGAIPGHGGAFDFAPLERAKGELLTLAVKHASAGVVLNKGHWLLPLDEDTAKVGATFAYDYPDLLPSAAARAALVASASELLGAERPFSLLGHDVGVRVTTGDRHPVVGRSPLNSHLGLFNGLGSKGALLAPRLARQWVNHLTEGVPFDPSVDVARFWK